MAHTGTFIFTLASFAVSDPWTLYPVLGAALTEGVAWWLRFQADGLHHLAEQSRRSALLMNAFGMTQEPAGAIDLRTQVSESLLKKARAYKDSDYYASTLNPGPDRLRELLQESSFWSKHLFREAGWWALGFGVAPILFLVVAAVLLGPVQSPIAHLILARVAVAALVVLVSVDQFSEGLGWLRASTIAERTDHALERARADIDADMLAVFAEYSVGTASAHPIPEWIYRGAHKRLEAAWKLRRAAAAGDR